MHEDEENESLLMKDRKQRRYQRQHWFGLISIVVVSVAFGFLSAQMLRLDIETDRYMGTHLIITSAHAT